ncbi:MAG: sigma-70 family RNA polymerase sigma factor [Verrucomicrobiota bacterium]
MNSISDEQLLRAIADSACPDSLQILLERYRTLVERISRTVLCEHQDIEDVRQEVFIQLQRKASSILVDDSLAPWLYRVTRQTALNYLRARQRRESRWARYGETEVLIGKGANIPDKELLCRELAELLDGCLEELEDENRDLIVRHYWNGQSVTEIAEQFEIRPDSVSMRLIRARKQLKKLVVTAGIGSSALTSYAEMLSDDSSMFGADLSSLLEESISPVASSASGIGSTGVSWVSMAIARPVVLLLASVGAATIAALLVSNSRAVESSGDVARSPSTAVSLEEPMVARQGAHPIDVLAKQMKEEPYGLSHRRESFVPVLRKIDAFIEDYGVDLLYTSDGQHLLHVASSVHADEIVAFLLLRGVDPDVEDNLGQTALFYVAGKGFTRAKIIRDLLCFAEADVDHRSTESKTPIMVAAENGLSENIEFLGWLGASLYPRDVPIELMPSVLALNNGHEDLYELLLKYENTPPPTLNDEPTEIPDFIQNSFIEAARVADFYQLDELLADGADIDGRDESGTTALLRAIRALQPEVVSYLLFMGADPNIGYLNGSPPLSNCMGWHGKNPDWMRAMLLLAGADVDHIRNDGHTALTRAIRRENTHGVQWCILYGADPDEETEMGTAMHYASKRSAQRIVDILSWNGVTEEPYSSDDPNWLLFDAVKRGDQDSIHRILEDQEASIDQLNDQGWSPLIAAIHSHRYDTARKLLELGSGINYQSSTGATPLYATCGWNSRSVNQFRQELIDAGADIELPNHRGETPLMRACKHGRFYEGGSVDQIIKAGANLYAKDDQGRTALDWAKESGRTGAYNHLLEIMESGEDR